MHCIPKPLPTTMPMSVFILSSTDWSSTMFMNWSNPRITPVTWRFALSVTAVRRPRAEVRPGEQ